MSSKKKSYLPFEAAEYHARTGLPWVTLSYAQTLDGSLALKQGQPSPISGRESMLVTHELRAAHDAILVGIGTVMADDPRLTVRLVDGEHPQPIILDSHLQFPENCRLCQHPKGAWIATTEIIDQAKPFRSKNIDLLVVPANADGRVALPQLLQQLGKRGIKSLMVEGGGRVITSFLKSSLVNRVVITLSPTFAGGYAAVDSLGINQWQKVPRLCHPMMRQVGADFLIWGEFHQ